MFYIEENDMTKSYSISDKSKFDDYMKIIFQLHGNGDFKNRPELIINYGRIQKINYFEHPELCIYSQWDKPWGIHKTGKNFPVMVTHKYFKDLHYNVFLSGAKLDGYTLVRYRKSRQKYPGYNQLQKIYSDKIETVIKEANQNNLSGGDPDIFVSKNSLLDSFFVEVKENDGLTDNQIRLFPIIEKYLSPVLLVRIQEK